VSKEAECVSIHTHHTHRPINFCLHMYIHIYIYVYIHVHIQCFLRKGVTPVSKEAERVGQMTHALDKVLSDLDRSKASKIPLATKSVLQKPIMFRKSQS